MNDDDPHFNRDKHHKNHVSKIGSNTLFGRPKVLDKRSLQHRRNLTHWCQRTVDAFELLAQIGEGTYGCVYKARDISKSMLFLKRVVLEMFLNIRFIKESIIGLHYC